MDILKRKSLKSMFFMKLEKEIQKDRKKAILKIRLKIDQVENK